MNKIIPFLIGFSLIAGSCKSKSSSAFMVKNEIDIATTKVVVYKKADILKKIGALESGMLPGAKDNKGNILPFQHDDLDGDGNWDELAIAVDLKKREDKKIVFYAFAKAESPKFTKTTDVHFGVGKAKPIVSEVQKYSRKGDPRENKDLFFQMEGPAWENDKVGFRVYFDPRNGIDIFGKTTSEPTLAKQGLETNYHEQAPWGMDILKVGNSLGAGSLAIAYKNELHRVTGVNGTTFKTITEGPVRAIFNLTFKNEKIGNTTTDIEQQITIERGTWYYKNDVTILNYKEGMQVVTGIVNLKKNDQDFIIFSSSSYLWSYGKQSENDDNLGMAILIPSNKVTVRNAPDKGDGIINTYLLYLDVGAKQTYYFMSGWEASDKQFKTKKGFLEAVQQAMDNL